MSTTINVEGRRDDLIGIASSAGQVTVGAEELKNRPILRSGEILETLPGLIITQHAGGGKANQYFLRGFNLDHGTDFAIFLDGMPLNLPSHAHGEGYSDMNTVIPVFVERVNAEKGPYYQRRVILPFRLLWDDIQEHIRKCIPDVSLSEDSNLDGGYHYGIKLASQ